MKCLPIKNRAAYNIDTFFANTINNQLMIYGTLIMIAAFLRPNLSAKMPDGTAPHIAPMANIDAIQVPECV